MRSLVPIRQSGFAARREVAQGYKGWPRALGWLQALLERGETAPDRQGSFSHRPVILPGARFRRAGMTVGEAEQAEG
jgi:hypothetical protein